MLSVCDGLENKNKIKTRKTQRNNNHEWIIYIFSQNYLYFNVYSIKWNGMKQNKTKWNAVHVRFKEPDKWNRNAVAAMKNFLLFFSAFQYKNRKYCSVECGCTRSAIFLKTIQAVSFPKLSSNGTSWSFNGACFVIYYYIVLCILRWYIT